MKKAVWIPLVCIGGIVVTFFAVIAISLGIIAYNKQNTYMNHPSAQPQTTWVTEDGKVELHFQGTVGHGTILTEDGPVAVAVSTSVQVTEIQIYHENEYQQMIAGDQPMGFGFAQGWGDVKNDHKFVIEITSADKYFEAGEKLVFYKVEE